MNAFDDTTTMKLCVDYWIKCLEHRADPLSDDDRHILQQLRKLSANTQELVSRGESDTILRAFMHWLDTPPRKAGAAWLQSKYLVPPRSAAFLFHLLMEAKSADAILGDLEERYRYLLKHFGRGCANVWYWEQTVLSLLSLAWNCVREVAGEYLALLKDVVVHFVFLCAFAVLSLGLEYVVDHVCAHGIELIVLKTIQVVFGASTIGPTIAWLIRDIKALWIRGKVKG
jgi:hypothetical protein